MIRLLLALMFLWVGPVSAASINGGGSGSGGLASTDIDTCAENAAIWTDETGTCGGPVLSQAPTIVSPIITTSLLIPNDTAVPGTCSIGMLFFDNNATAGVNLYGCTASNTWTLLGDGGGAAAVATDTIWDAAGDLVYGTGANTAVRLAPGTTGQVLTLGTGPVAPAWSSTLTALTSISFGADPGDGSPLNLSNNTCINWEIATPGTDKCLKVNASDQLDFNGSINLSGSATGSLRVNGVTSGSLSITTADATAQAITISGAAQTTGGTTLTIPDQAGTNRNFVFDTLTQTLSGKTLSDAIITSSVNLPNGAAPTTDAFGEVAADNNAWAASRGTLQIYDGTANTYAVNVLASDAPGNGECPKWNTGGTITWETCSGGSGTVTNTGGNLTSNSVVLGAGTVDTKVVAGITTDGTSVLNLGVNATTIGKVKMFGNTSGDATIQPAAVAGTATVLTLPAASDTLVGKATTDTLTNKTLDAEGTGNLLTIPRRIWLPAAGCNNATAGSIWDLPTSNPAVAACVTGTNTQKGVLDFADGANTLSAQLTLKLPSTWTGTVDANIKWFSATTTGDVVWQLATICVADAETDDPAFNTASTVTDTAKGTTNQTNDAAITTVTVTGCAAGELMHVKIIRDPAHASDTHAATARLIGVELVIREAI